MLNMVKGTKINFSNKLNENFEVDEENNLITANVNAENILELIKKFVKMQNGSLFLILEVPSKLDDEKVRGNEIIGSTHMDVYYLDNISNEMALNLLDIFGNLFINDGLGQIGIGNLVSQAEIMTGKYNIVTIFFGEDGKEKYRNLFIENNISEVDNLITAWDYITEENPGINNSIKENGKTIYDAVDVLEKNAGLYFAEKREE